MWDNARGEATTATPAAAAAITDPTTHPVLHRPPRIPRHGEQRLAVTVAEVAAVVLGGNSGLGAVLVPAGTVEIPEALMVRPKKHLHHLPLPHLRVGVFPGGGGVQTIRTLRPSLRE